MTERTKTEVKANEERALRRVTELVYKNTDLRRECDRLRTRGEHVGLWIAKWKHLLPEVEVDAALRGDAPPKGTKR